MLWPNGPCLHTHSCLHVQFFLLTFNAQLHRKNWINAARDPFFAFLLWSAGFVCKQKCTKKQRAQIIKSYESTQDNRLDMNSNIQICELSCFRNELSQCFALDSVSCWLSQFRDNKMYKPLVDHSIKRSVCSRWTVCVCIACIPETLNQINTFNYFIWMLGAHIQACAVVRRDHHFESVFMCVCLCSYPSYFIMSLSCLIHASPLTNFCIIERKRVRRWRQRRLIRVVCVFFAHHRMTPAITQYTIKTLRTVLKTKKKR